MSSMLYLLSLCVVTVIQLTSSQSVQEVLQKLDELQSQLTSQLTQLQSDVEELKDGSRLKVVTGKLLVVTSRS